MAVVDLTPHTCLAYKGKPLNISNVTHLVIHRCDLHQIGPDNPHPVADEMLDGQTLAMRFRASTQPPPYGLGTYGRIPYHAVVDLRANIQQILPLSLMGAHAIGYNWRSWGVAVVGDTDQRPATADQWEALVWVCSSLAVANRGLIISGHTSLPGASADPTKRCPGRYLPVTRLGVEAERRMPPGWQGADQGMVANWLRTDGWTL